MNRELYLTPTAGEDGQLKVFALDGHPIIGRASMADRVPKDTHGSFRNPAWERLWAGQ